MKRRFHTGDRRKSVKDREKLRKNKREWNNQGVFIVTFVATFFFLFKLFPPTSLPDGSPSGESFDIVKEARLNIEFSTAENLAISLGPHKVHLQFNGSCKHPKLWLRIEGDALVVVRLSESFAKDNSWSGTFSLPIEGKFKLAAHWYGCDLQNTDKHETISVKEFQAVGTPTASVLNATSTMFPTASWISSEKFPQLKRKSDHPYIWHDPTVPMQNANILSAGSIHLSREGSVGPSGFYQFSELSNYELVCWIGSESAKSMREAFLQFRGFVAAGQRPFKFHHFPSPAFEKPDREWTEETKKRLKKCKHILISFDELEKPLSQSDYISQSKTFINHVLKVMPDETFPIWMFTVSESPMQPTNCNTGEVPLLPRTSDHPCNDALKDLFQKSQFPRRVQLLDGTDVSLPQLGESKDVVTAAIAMRIFVFVGKQVETWRKAGQKGTVQGLVRGGKTEPNIEFIPYTEWS